MDEDAWGTCDLHVHSCYSFLDGASHPEELVQRAVELGYTALALTDHDGLYGAHEFAQAALAAGLQPITGAEVTLEDEAHLTLLAETREGYANLCRLLSHAHRESERRSPRLPYSMLAEHARGLIGLSGCRRGEIPQLLDQGQSFAAERAAERYREWFGGEGFFLEVQQNLAPGDLPRIRALAALGERLKLPLVGTNNSHYHVRERARLQDTLVSIRHGVTLPEARRWRRPNSEYHLKRPVTLRARFAPWPEALENALIIAHRCRAFNLVSDLGYSFPDFLNETGDEQYRTADEALRLLCEEALTVKYGRESPERQAEARRWLEQELRLVSLHGLGGFFLVYRDLLQMSKQVAAEIRGTGARGRFELPPGRGRGSAVSSIICYLIGLSPIDPVQAKLFPGRFLNESLQSVPDIDLDFPRDIRSRLIERVHQHYGRDHVALVCTFPTYKFRGAVREIGKVLALPPAELDRFAKLGDGHTRVPQELARLAEFSTYGSNRQWALLSDLSEELWGMPRHISQHVGGMVISSRPLVEIVPVENSAIEGRQLLQWDKDSVDGARMIKVDFLALGMLSAVERCLELIVANGKAAVDLSRIDFQDQKLFDRIGRGETIGSFQIESRAQVGMLPRTLPRNMDDLAIQVAIVRPGPIVGRAVTPYVRQRQRQREESDFRPHFDHPLLRPVLADTLGTILYQDQVMEVCKALAGFTDGQADQLRRAMSRKRSRENLARFEELFKSGAASRGVRPEIAHRVFQKVLGFSGFGFPKSHAYAFGLLAYQSMWLLQYYPVEFLAGLLNEQPMGFYPPDTLIKEGQRYGVRFRAPDLNRSEAECTVRGGTVQLGLGIVHGVGRATAAQIVAERQAHGRYASLPDFIRRTRLSDRVAEHLVLVGALDAFGLNRRELVWQLGLLYGQRGKGTVERTSDGPRLLGMQLPLTLSTEQDEVTLAAASRWERLAHEYGLMSLSVNDHPLRVLRPLLPPEIVSVQQLRECPHKSVVSVAGMVTTRQRPESANGIMFSLLEDETGMVNVVVRPELYEQARELYRGEPMLVVQGVLERQGRRINLVAVEAWPLHDWLPDVKNSAGRKAHQAVLSFAVPRGRNYR